MGKIFAIANQKGGVGKTTTAVNLASCVAALGKKVLLCDFDPQGNATSGTGVVLRPGRDIYDALISSVPTSECIQKTQWCDVFPSDIRLAAAELELSQEENREAKLASILAPVVGNYDYIFIDCPPSLGLLTINALCACSQIIVPMQCEYFALEGLSQLVSSIRTVRRMYKPELDIEGIILTMFDSRTNLSIQVAEELKRHFGAKVYKTAVPRSVRLAEAPSHGKPILAYDRLSRGAEAYSLIAQEFLKRNR